jgi:hypothetical protein
MPRRRRHRSRVPSSAHSRPRLLTATIAHSLRTLEPRAFVPRCVRPCTRRFYTTTRTIAIRSCSCRAPTRSRSPTDVKHLRHLSVSAAMKSLAGSIASKLHPNKLITNVESQRLLQALLESSKRHLNNAQPQRSANLTRHHWDSVLHHPMFESRKLEAKVPTSTFIYQPALHFESLARRGHLSWSTVSTLCEKYMRLKRSREVHKIKPLAPGLAAWMATTNREEMTASFRALEKIIQVMYLDGQEESVLEWLRELYATTMNSSRDSTHLETEDRFISAMIRGVLYVQNDLSLAIQHFIEASKYRHGSKRAIGDTPISGTKAPLAHSWDRLAWFILQKRGRAAIDDEQYRVLLSHAPEPNATPWARISPGFVRLYSPDSNRTTAMHHEIQDRIFLMRWRTLKMTCQPKILRPFLISLLDAASFAVSDGHPQRAQLFLDFAHREFPDVLPERASSSNNLAEVFQQAYREISPWSMGHGSETAFG